MSARATTASIPARRAFLSRTSDLAAHEDLSYGARILPTEQPYLPHFGLIVADNVLWSGKVVDPKDADAHAIVAFDRLVQSDSRVENVCLTVRDGMMLAWKRG